MLKIGTEALVIFFVVVFRERSEKSAANALAITSGRLPALAWHVPSEQRLVDS